MFTSPQMMRSSNQIKILVFFRCVRHRHSTDHCPIRHQRSLQLERSICRRAHPRRGTRARSFRNPCRWVCCKLLQFASFVHEHLLETISRDHSWHFARYRSNGMSVLAWNNEQTVARNTQGWWGVWGRWKSVGFPFFQTDWESTNFV